MADNPVLGAATYTFRVAGMHCSSCGLLIDDELHDLPGVLSAQTSSRAGTSTVTLDPATATPAAVIVAIEAAGYTARLEASS